MADIFLSYSRGDAARARVVAEALKAASLSVWWDPDIEHGEDFRSRLEAEIAASRRLIVLWSPLSIRSQFVRDEADEAQQQSKLISVLIGRISPPLGLRQSQTVDLSDWSDDSAPPTALSDFCSSLAIRLGKTAGASSPLLNDTKDVVEPDSHLRPSGAPAAPVGPSVSHPPAPSPSAGHSPDVETVRTYPTLVWVGGFIPVVLLALMGINAIWSGIDSIWSSLWKPVCPLESPSTYKDGTQIEVRSYRLPEDATPACRALKQGGLKPYLEYHPVPPYYTLYVWTDGADDAERALRTMRGLNY